MRIFLSYRRTGASYAVDQLERDLKGLLDDVELFRDIRNIRPGEDFRIVIRNEITKCQLLLAIIDQGWKGSELTDGTYRIHNPDDWVRLEVETALMREIPVIPVLLQNARQPRAEDLPTTLQALVYIHSLELRPATQWEADIGKLAECIRNYGDAIPVYEHDHSRFVGAWDGGDWVDARRSLDRLLENPAMKASPTRLAGMNSKAEYLDLLVKCADLLQRHEFREAEELLASVKHEHAPPNVGVALRIAAAGSLLQSALPGGDREAIGEARRGIEAAREEAGRLGVNTTPGEREVVQLLEKAERDAALIEARALYDEGRFGASLASLEELSPSTGSIVLAELCARGIEFHAALAERRWEDAREIWDEVRARESAARLPASERRQQRNECWRKWCNQLRRVGPVLEQMSEAPAIPAVYVPTEVGPSPYRVLGVAAGISEQECKDLSFDLAGRPERMSQRERTAWDALRLPVRRFAVDFGLYRVQDLERVARMLGFLETTGEEPDPFAALLERLRDSERSVATRRDGDLNVRQALATALKEDAGVFHAGCGCHEDALQFLLECARGKPDDPNLLHQLALAAAERLLRPGAQDETDLTETADLLILGLGAVFADDRFWLSAWAQRRRSYTLDRTQVQEARLLLERFWIERLGTLEDQLPGLATALQVELAGARAVLQGGGIPIGEAGVDRVVVGRVGARMLGVEEALSRWVASLERAEVDGKGWQNRVCQFFSGLSEAAALYESRAFEDVVARLSERKEASPGSFSQEHPALAALDRRVDVLNRMRRRLLQGARFQLALGALSQFPVAVDAAVANWSAGLSEGGGNESREKLLDEIRDLAIGRAHSLGSSSRKQEDRGQRLEALNDSVRLLQEVINEGWDNADGSLRHAFVESLLNRAVLLSNEFDAEKEARLDARRAWTLSPRSVRAITVLAMASLHYAKELFFKFQGSLAEAVLQEVSDLLEQGTELYPGNNDVERCVQSLAAGRDLIAGNTCDALDEALKGLKAASSEPSGEPGRATLADAMIREARGDFEGAVAAYRQLLERAPEDLSLRSKLSSCFRTWILHLKRTAAEPKEIAEVTKQAMRDCPGSDALTDLVAELNEDSSDDEMES